MAEKDDALAEEEITRIFCAWDINGDGVISKNELRRVMKAIVPDLDEEGFQQLWKDLNKKTDDALCYEEFVDWFSKDPSEIEVKGVKTDDFIGKVREELHIDDDTAGLINALLDKARDKGSSKDAWSSIAAELRKHPTLVNIKPGKRKFQLVHHAIWWANCHALFSLVHDFHAHLNVRTTLGKTCLELGRELLAGKTTGKGKDPEVYKDIVALLERLTTESVSAYDFVGINEMETLLAKSESKVRTWMWEAGNGFEREWMPYGKELQKTIEDARKDGADTVEVMIQDQAYEIDFAEMKQTMKKSKSRVRKLKWVNVLWEWNQGETGKEFDWKPYSPSDQWKLEEAFLKRHALVDLQVGDTSYQVDIVAMRQYRVDNPMMYRFVQRMGVPLSNKLKNKRVVVGSATDGKDHVDLTDFPEYWVELGIDKCPAGDIRRIRLGKEHKMTKLLGSWMNDTIVEGHHPNYGNLPGDDGIKPTRFEVEDVEVIHNPRLWHRYCAFRGGMQLQVDEIRKHAGTAWLKAEVPDEILRMPTPDDSFGLDETILEQYFWHGTGKNQDGSFDIVEAIVEGREGADFTTSVSEGLVGRFSAHAMFGPGLYLADLSSKSNLYVPCPKCHGGSYFRHACSCDPADVEKGPAYRMVLCRAVLGKVFVDLDYRKDRYVGLAESPAKLLGADSVMGESCAHPECEHKLSFREFVVYDDRAVYPEFILYYRRRA